MIVARIAAKPRHASREMFLAVRFHREDRVGPRVPHRQQHPPEVDPPRPPEGDRPAVPGCRARASDGSPPRTPPPTSGPAGGRRASRAPGRSRSGGGESPPPPAGGAGGRGSRRRRSPRTGRFPPSPPLRRVLRTSAGPGRTTFPAGSRRSSRNTHRGERFLWGGRPGRVRSRLRCGARRTAAPPRRALRATRPRRGRGTTGSGSPRPAASPQRFPPRPG